MQLGRGRVRMYTLGHWTPQPFYPASLCYATSEASGGVEGRASMGITKGRIWFFRGKANKSTNWSTNYNTS